MSDSVVNDSELSVFTRFTKVFKSNEALGRFFSIGAKVRDLSEFRVLFIILYASAVLDAWISWVAIGQLSLAVEGNPLLVFLFSKIGVLNTMIVRALWGVVLVWGLGEMIKRVKPGVAFKFSKFLLWGITVVFVLLLFYHVAAFWLYSF